MAELLYRLGRAAARRAWTVIALWLAALLAAAGAYALFAGELEETFSLPGTPTSEVSDRLADEFSGMGGGSGTIVLHTQDGEPFTDEQRSDILDRLDEAEGVDGVESAADPFAIEARREAQREEIDEGRAEITGGREEIEAGLGELETAREQAEAAGTLDAVAPQIDPQITELEGNLAELEEGEQSLEEGARLLELSDGIRMVSEDGATALVTVAFTEEQNEIAQETKDEVIAAFEEIPGVDTEFGSDVAMTAPELFGVGEAVGLAVAAVVLVIMLGTLVGAGLPLVQALVGVGVALLAALALSDLVAMSSVTPILGMMLGLAVGIDYALFIIHRHRRQARGGLDIRESIALANGTAGNAVVFAGATVLVALLGLNLTGIDFLGMMGNVGALAVAVAVLVAVTLTPALLSLVGGRILSRKERASAGSTPGGHDEATARPMRTLGALVKVVLVTGALLVVAVPALDLRLGLPDGSREAHDSTQYRAYTAVDEAFGAGANGPLVVVADLPGSQDEEEAAGQQLRVAEEIADQDAVAAVAPVALSDDRSVSVFQVLPTEGPSSESTEALVHELRGLDPFDDGAELGVAGTASGNIDISDKLSDALPGYLAVVVGFSLVILLVVFRSLLVPVVATLGFVLSFAAALGGVVAIYQWGWLGGVFGVDSPGPVLSFLPTIMVGILFGLAMDYMLFLGSGMREAYVHGAPARSAVREGLVAGRAVVTAAAVIMISVFAGFIFSHTTMIRPVGFALAFGVLVDAFAVRLTLIPALLHLAGDKAWWLPRWLDRILPDVDVEGARLERVHTPDSGREEETPEPVGTTVGS
ncbi:MMPL family transporter [Nocardiopsis lucentensis]|uniref:MMPL family transporter n=1 Tax=Nocardiopsis lucentensis TaxID=53441 RepID=UPI00034D51FF|nr:MMPL family transporter [Nocardiopsis lucentensis]